MTQPITSLIIQQTANEQTKAFTVILNNMHDIDYIARNLRAVGNEYLANELEVISRGTKQSLVAAQSYMANLYPSMCIFSSELDF
jgi:hypothetical protein